ncbi:hypothetical protein VTJ83DRAFT_1408 [Remersonia thermophila]|uniref:Cytochrome P450 n=1 Tax=Remersonia thermophila TaxID=72144 RepID=A0ABR4DP77_9PEZI
MFLDLLVSNLPLLTRLLAWSLAIGPVAYLVLTAVYNLTLHPLASYPGPLLSRATPFPHALRLVSGRIPQALHALHERYGPVVRVGPNHLSYTDPRAWRDVMGHRVEAFIHQPENRKSRLYYRESVIDRSGGLDDPAGKRKITSILDADREEHGRMRRALAHGFSERAVRAQEELVRGYVALLAERLRRRAEKGEKVDMAAWLNWTTFDVIGDLVFAESFGCLEEERGHLYVTMVTGFVKQMAMFMGMKYLGLHWWKVVRWGANALERQFAGDLLKKMHRIMEDKLKRRLDVKGEREDLFEGLMKKKDELNLRTESLRANASVITAAGSETTASALSGAIYLLLRNPAALARLQHEVRSSCETAADINLAAVSRMPYLLACINESLRRFPPAANLPREVHEGGEVIAGRFVPEKTIVEVPHYAMNHSSRHWRDPFAFRPERWLSKVDSTAGEVREGSHAEAYGDRLEVMQVFNVGPRNCLGRNLAYAEMRLILARLVYDFDWRLADESRDWMDKAKGFTTWVRDPLYVYLTPARRDVA